MEKSGINKKKWFKNPAYLGVLVAFIGIVVTIIIYRFPIKESDFSITVSPILSTLQKSEEIQALIDIKSINGYDYPVSLTAKNLPYDVFVELNPKYGNSSSGFESKMSIRAGSEAQKGQYTVEIIGNGSDGKEHICKYILNVVVPPPPLPNYAYVVYNDLGIASGDILNWSGLDWGKEPPILSDGNYVVENAPEGNECYATTIGSGKSNYAGWGVFLGIFENHKIVTPHKVDLNEYNNLQFWVKSTINLKVELQEENETGRKSTSCFISNFGWKNESVNTWQKIVIPKNSFHNIDFKQIWCPFMITGVGANITFLVDDISWNP